MNYGRRLMNKDELTGLEIDHIRVNQPDLEYCISLIDGELAQIYALNHGNRALCGLKIMQRIEQAVREEAAYRAQQRVEE
jgi:hypothetical protein